MRFDLGLEFWKLIACEVAAGGRPSERRRLLKHWIDSGDADPRLMQADQMLATGANGLTITEMYQRGAAEFHVMVNKAAVAAGTTGDATWASPLVALQTLVNAAFLNLAPYSALDFLSQHALPVPAGVRVPIETGSEVIGHVVVEGDWIPVDKAGFTNSAFTTPTKVGCIVPVTDELRRFSANGAAAYLNQIVGRAVGRRVDAKLVDILKGTTPPLPPVIGDDVATIRNLFAAVPLGSGSRPVLLGAPSKLVDMALDVVHFPDLAVMGGGSIGGVPVQPVDALEGGTSPNERGLLLVDASRVTIDSGTLELAAFAWGALNMVDNPSGPANLVSLPQTNTVAVRGVRYFSASRPVASAVAWIQES
jgi:hypothetical protein